jgi:hypothetical protein
MNAPEPPPTASRTSTRDSRLACTSRVGTSRDCASSSTPQTTSLKGVFHDGPRAFSQAHFANTKAHDDVAAVLLDAGASEASVLSLGLRRSPYLGLGGPVILRTSSGQELNLGLLDGPVRFRADQRAHVKAVTEATILLIIENLQAAETACDQFPYAVVAWTAGPPAGSPNGSSQPSAVLGRHRSLTLEASATPNERHSAHTVPLAFAPSSPPPALLAATQSSRKKPAVPPSVTRSRKEDRRSRRG